MDTCRGERGRRYSSRPLGLDEGNNGSLRILHEGEAANAFDLHRRHELAATELTSPGARVVEIGDLEVERPIWGGIGPHSSRMSNIPAASTPSSW